MSDYTKLYITKTANAFDDTLLAFGVAEIVAILLHEQTKGTGDITISDKGSYIQLDSEPPLMLSTIEKHAEFVVPAPYIISDKSPLPEGMNSLVAENYDEHREVSDKFYATDDKETATAPHPRFDILKAIKDFSKFNILGSYNTLIKQWHSMGRTPETLLLILDTFAELPNDWETSLERWQALSKEKGWGYHTKSKYESTALQLYNPASGKGQNRSKSDGVTMSNIGSFWVVEYLKATGFYQAALTRQLRGSGDQKTLVLAPRKMRYTVHQRIISEFRGTMRYAETSTRFDLLAIIRYTQALLRYLLEDDSEVAQFFGDPQDLVTGFHTAFYKDMGNAVTTMNLSFVALPGWVQVQSNDDIRQYDALLDDLTSLVTQFDEGNSDAFTLLQHLRDFVSGNDLSAFFKFTDAYPAYLMGHRERGQFARQVTTEFIERLIMQSNKPLQAIVQSEGFQNIAYAIRQATVTAQYRKRQGDKKYEVRYGLGQTLSRKASYPDDFIVALSEFLHKYNAENARVLETRPQPYRRSIQTSDIDEIVRLIDEYGSEVVAQLLIAYGHARVPREDDFEMNDNQSNEQE